MANEKYGVVLLRAQPIHKGHLSVIQKAVDENDKVLVVIGSANKAGTQRNPIDIDVRFPMVHKAVANAINNNDKVVFGILSDWSMEDAYNLAKEWGNFFYYNVVNMLKSKTFTLYYNDDQATVRNWFTSEIAHRVTIKSSNRVGLDMSSTKVREAVMNDDFATLERMLDETTLGYLPEIKMAIENAKQDDFIMQ